MEFCVSVHAERESKFFWAAIHALFKKVESTLVKAKLKNNYASGNMAVKFCEIFTHPLNRMT